jgi:DNA-binding Xre family transcriptional regulator
MIESKIREVAQARGIQTAYQLQVALDVFPSVAARLWKGEFTRISLETMDRLCTMFHCQPGKLFHHTPDSEK